MRSSVRRLIVALALTFAAPLLVTLTPAVAHADTCYNVQVGPQWVTVCP